MLVSDGSIDSGVDLLYTYLEEEIEGGSKSQYLMDWLKVTMWEVCCHLQDRKIDIDQLLLLKLDTEQH